MPLVASEETYDAGVRTPLVALLALLLIGTSCVTPGPSGPPKTEGVTVLPSEDTWKWTTTVPAADQRGVAFDLVSIGRDGYAVTSSGGSRILWTSSDGSSWTSTPAPGLTGSILVDLIDLPDGHFLATGVIPDNGGLFVRFNAHESTITDAGATTIVATVATTGPGYLAAGGTLDGATSKALLWRSDDALSWQVADGPEDALFDPVISGSGGWLAASNASRPEFGDAHADVWRSSDLASWELSSSFLDSAVAGVVAIETGFVAAGTISFGRHDLNPVTWRSVDGQTWTPVDRKDIFGGLAGIVRWRDAIVAFGSSIEPERGIVWLSDDGVTWTEVRGVDLDGMRLSDAATSDDELMIVGDKGGEPLVLRAKISN
jgi:hypothetical protein